MQKRIQKWKRFLAIFLMGAMLLTNDYGLTSVFAEETGSNTGNTRAGGAATNIELNADVLINNDDGVVDAGEKFQYQLQYTVPNLESGSGQYTGAMLMFYLPEYVHLVTDKDGKPIVTGADFQRIEQNKITGEYTIFFKDPLPMHATNTLTIDMMTKNLVTPDDLVLDFDTGFVFQTQFKDASGQSPTTQMEVKAGTIKTNAESTWEITKENTTLIDGHNYKKVGSGANATFEVTYRVKVQDKEGRDRLGRLGFESYQVTDTLPTDLPVGGEAIAIKDVYLVRSTGKETTAHTVTKDSSDHPTAITFTEYDVIKEGDPFGEGETSQYLEVGDTTNTTYEYTVVYSYPPYTTPGDRTEIEVHTLENTATLNYKLVGKDAAIDSDVAQVSIGAYEDNVVKANVLVEKYIKFANAEPEKLNSAIAEKYGFDMVPVKFTMYTDSACTNIAYSTTHDLMQNIGIDANGVATFENIRKGTYYIKEVSSHEGWQNAAVITVVVNEDGTVAYPDGATAFAAVNMADTINAVEFTKSGIDAYGNEDAALGGATFTLTSGSNTYTATSDANGRVRFDNIPDGEYTLAETAISADLAAKGYTVSDTTYPVSVSGGEVVTPDLSAGNTYENISTKGLLKIIKIDAQNNETKLSGAVFEVYGPYETQEAADADKGVLSADNKAATLTTGTDGTITSGPLQKGFYVLVETKAPTNYTSSLPIVAEVTEQTTFSVTAENDPQAKVYFTKKGAEYQGAPIVQELPGTVFEIYDASGNRLYGVADSDGNYADVSTDATGRTAVTITTELDTTGISVSNYVTLSPGTYKYKETVAPDPFVAEEELVEFTVGQVAPSEGSNEWNTTQTTTVNNYLQYGQIRIVKTADDGAVSKNALNDAVFGVYASAADANADKNRLDTITTGTYNENGVKVNGIGYTDARLDLNKTYYIKEVTAPAGYALNSTVKEVTLTSENKLVEWECENKRTVSIEITKTDSVTGAKLQGAKFGLYSATNNSSKLAEATTDANGIVTFGNLDPNTTYYYKEISAPKNYVITDSSFNEITTGSTGANATVTASETNARKATFKLHKEKEGGAAFNGVTFKLISVSDSAKDILADTNNLSGGTSKTTNSSGNASFTGLTPGDYWLVEIVPEGYETGKANGVYVVNEADGWKVVTYNNQEYFYKKVTVDAGQNISGYTQKTEDITNTPTKGKIKITKYEAKDDGTASTTTIGDVVFTIYSDSACTQVVTTVTTGDDGTITTAFLAPRTYYVKETAVPEGYVLSDEVHTVVVSAGSTTSQTIVNNKEGSFTINKVAAYIVQSSAAAGEVAREPLKGAKFALYKYDESRDGQNGLPANIEASAIVKTLDMTERTSVSSGTLEPGIYWLREIVTPDGYDGAPDSLVQVYADGTVKFATWTAEDKIGTWTSMANNTITVDNLSENPRIRLIKTAFNQPQVMLDGARFEVYVETTVDDPDGTEMDVDGEKVNLKHVYDDGTFVDTDDNSPLVLESGTARNPLNPNESVSGNALTPELKAGHIYYFKEIKAPEKDANDKRVYYHFDPDDIWQSVEIPEGATGEYRVTFVNYPDVQAPGVKYAEDGTTPLSGAVMVVFDNETDANAMLDKLRNTYNEATNPLTETTVRENKDAWNIDEISVSAEDGTFSFANLIPGKYYYIVEVVAPNGYQMDKNESGDYFYYKVKVADTIGNGNPFSEVYIGTERLQNTYTLSIKNYAKQQIWLDKKVKVSGAEYWVEGAQFTIYPDVNGQPGTTPVDTMKVSDESLPGRFLSGLLPAGTYWLRETTVPDGFTEAQRDVKNPAFGEDAQDSYIFGTARYYKVVLGREEDNTWFREPHPVYNVAENGRFALTKINSVTNNNVVATFTVEKVGDDKFTSFVFTTSTSGYYLSEYLPSGIYKLTEKSVTGNYTKLDEPIYIKVEGGKITDGSNKGTEKVGEENVTVYMPASSIANSGSTNPTLTNPITVENVPQGKFFIKKTGMWNNTEKENLADVTFAVYKKTSDNFENDKNAGFIKTITTDSDGIADSGILDAGNYWVIETGITGPKADEYIKDSYTVFEVTVTAGKTDRVTDNTYNVVNTSNYGKFEITKVDSVDANTKIPGVTFKIYDNAECTGDPVGEMVDNMDGTYTSPRLPIGKNYYLKETAVPNDYTINAGKVHSQAYTVTANTLTTVQTPVTNEHDKSLTVYKYEMLGDTKTENVINGAVFGLYATAEDAANGANPIGGVVKTTVNGYCTWNGLSDGTYYLKEISAPSYYIKDDTVYTINISGKNDNSFAYSTKVYNLRKGGFELDKVILWTNGTTALPGKNITFDLYKDSIAEENKLTASRGITTNLAGKISYANELPAGDYILVERGSIVDGVENAYTKPGVLTTGVDGNFIDNEGNIHIRVLPSQTNTVFTAENAVKNNANYGRFQLLKKTYANDQHTETVGLNGAEYKLDRFDTSTNAWVTMGTIAVNDGDWSNGVYESGAMVPGKYRVTETKAPDKTRNTNNIEVDFTINPTPIEFTVTAATTVPVEQYDGIYRHLVVTKKTDTKNGSQKLADVTFELYYADNDASIGEYAYDGKEETLAAYIDADNKDRIGAAQTTGNDGVVTFTHLEPGKYVLVETAVPEGYSKKLAVLVVDESLSWNDVAHDYTLVNASQMGRIIIRKEDTEGNLITQNSAQNAQFAIYAEDDTNLKTPLCTVSVDQQGYAKTSLLEGEKYYWVVETKAPNGYTLDNRLLPNKKLVYVTGDQNPDVNFSAMSKTATTGYEDGVIFQNRTPSTVFGTNASIQKLVRLAGGTEFADDFVASTDSLMFKDVTAEFKITNLTSANRRNEIPFEEFVVTDQTLMFMDKNGTEITALANPTSDDYVMNKITIGQATNEDATKPVSAEVFVKVGNTSADTEWQTVKTVNVSSGAQEVVLPANAVAFKVEYNGTDVGFIAGDIVFEVTFKQRPSDPNVPQVRKVENTAVLNWEDTSRDENGNAKHQTGSDCDAASVTFPAYDEKIPTLALKNDIVNKPSSGKYYSGGTIDFETKGTVPETSPADLQHPVMAINLPPYTTLDTTKYTELEGGNNGIRATLPNGTVCSFTVRKIMETNADGQLYEKYVLDFGKEFVLAKDESITLEYTANISLNVPDTTLSIESRGFIGSARQLPLTAENPTGMSYRQADSDGSTVTANDTGFDSGLKDMGNSINGDKLTYLRRPVHVELTRTDSRLIRKYVSVDGENWLSTETPTVKPGDNYYYKLTLVNGGDPVRRARIVDILPFDGDTQEFRAIDGGSIMSRATDLPSGVGYEQVELVAVAPQSGEGMTATVYYYVESDDVINTVANRDWTAANRDSDATKDLPMLTSNAAADAVWAGWTTTAPADMSTVTAIGVEVVFAENASLDSGETYDVVLTMRAPGYTAEQMYEYEDALIANTTAATVTQVGAEDTSSVTAIDRISSNEVYTKLYITTGALGDYAFYDNNDNGIQDEGDVPARNIPVTLYRRKTIINMTEEPEWEVYKTTYTDQTTGKYWFDQLPCNYLIPGLDQNAEGFDPTNPANYIGNTYFEYQVEFGIPEGYAATIQEVGEDRPVDSNINEFGVTKPVTLALTVNANGKLEGEINPTIDAGYVKLVNLGDYVWVDYNKNGVQDESEVGLNGATVRLYKLESAEDTIEGKQPYRTQLTANNGEHDGYYCFTDLPKGYYVVEFDISTVDKPVGYTTKYSFTVNDAGSDGADSDAAFVKDDNNQIMYTEVIHLTEDDMTWDAGVTVYSALGGFVFDDQDYDDTQSIETELEDGSKANGIPLAGTVVTLYKVNEDGSMDPEAIGSQTVGEDGRYFFDKLDAGRYKVHFDYPDEYIGVQEGVGDYLHDSETKFFDDSTLNSGFTDIIELPEDTIDLTHDAGAYLLSAIGDYVWEDINRDGIQDQNEKPVADIVVTLQQKLGDGEWTTIETTTTDEKGLYLFDGLKSSDHFDVQYRVAFAIPLTVELTGDNAGEDRAQDSNALPTLDVEYGYFTKEIILPYGQDDMTIDAGLYYRTELCEVGDYVWYDEDRDGIQDTNEKGVEGIVVVLERCDSGETWNEEAWEVVGTTKTDANGKYIFTDLQPGYYRVAFGVGDPWIVTISRVGDIALDSDAIRPDGDSYYSSSFYLNAGDSDMTWDAGIYKPIVPEETETGDNANISIWLCALGASVFVLVLMLKKRKEI